MAGDGAAGGEGPKSMLADAVGGLRAKLEAREAQVRGFCAEMAEETAAHAGDAESKLEDLRARIEALAKEREELASMGWANEQRLAAQQKKVAALHDELDGLRTNYADVENAMQNANNRRTELLGTLGAKEADIEAERETQQHRVAQLTRGATLYKKLGLEFQRDDNTRLRLSFTQIDPRDPDREFFFVIFVDKDDCYHVEQVEPAVGSISDLIRRVNATNDFSSFVRSMRTKFQALCATS
ncbi:Kinetochore protein Spc25 [Hondaea fermentalgiana]|uniref:Kinetochore protein SPC25 n=1 Tax=Hondaea fermentalgiana TaxID=2315210 RepID=A0A2R5G4Q6_9STRA|nr:Kinetochore protein Spc25 [Hondaea fermentalgiana]|eukprot:GBG26012.1 Kinetochore protein Spc25 [Hondaea fermentalgiana]